MYSFKKYTHRWDFISEIPLQFIKSTPTFHETINSWQWECVLEISNKVSENFIDFWNLVRIFYDWRYLYSGFVIRKEFKVSAEWDWYTISLIWVFDALRNYDISKIKSYKYHKWEGEFGINTDWSTVVWRASTFFQDMIYYLRETECNIYRFDINEIYDPTPEQHKSVKWTFLDLLDFYKKQFNMEYFIWADWLLIVSWGNKFRHHNLIFKKDVMEITTDSDILNMANSVFFIREYYVNGLRTSGDMSLSDEESIRKYWLKYKNFWEYTYNDYKDAENKIKELLETHKNPTYNIKLKIYNKKWFWALQVLDRVTIKNIKQEIIKKKIVKISYNADYMEVELESYNTLWNILLWQ